MYETTNAIPGYAHTHGYGDYGNGYGRNDDNCVHNQINQLADQVSANGIREAVNSVGANVVGGTASVKDTVNGVNQNVTAGNYTTLTGLNDLGRDISGAISHVGSDFINAINSSNIATLTGFNNANIATLTGFNNTNAQVAQGFNQSFIQSKDILSAMASCCCEIKERFCETDKLILSEGQTTRALITDNRMHDLEDKLHQAQLKASQLEQTNALVEALGKTK